MTFSRARDYIQELDADDIFAPDKIEKQLATLREGDSKRILLSGPYWSEKTEIGAGNATGIAECDDRRKPAFRMASAECRLFHKAADKMVELAARIGLRAEWRQRAK
jgi:hypothetical protein